jgi:1-acyl-sn-glycerol-3-phosphate acyltransferase
MRGWQETPLLMPKYRVTHWVRVAWRGAVLGLVTYGCLVLLLLVRLIEWPLFGQARPLTPHITQFVCRFAFFVLRLPLVIRGQPMAQKGAIVANHSSWLDIFALNAAQRIYFVAKSEVAGWPGIGWLARATGTVFITRRGSEAKKQQHVFETRLRAGHRLMFFPEGTSTDAMRVLAFKSTLFQAFYSQGLGQDVYIQPVSVVYHAPPGQDPRFYGWWGDMEFAPHLLLTLATGQQGKVEVIFHPEVRVDAFSDRKALAAHCERIVRAGHPFAVQPNAR